MRWGAFISGSCVVGEILQRQLGRYVVVAHRGAIRGSRISTATDCRDGEEGWGWRKEREDV